MKRHNIDGLPGITMHGKKGPDGPRGGMTFCNKEASVTFENIEMDDEYTYSLGVVYIGKEYKILPFISNKIAPIKDDYVLNVTASCTELYTITEELIVPYDDVSDYISAPEYNENGVLDTGFKEEIIIVGGEENEEENEDNRFIKFGDTSIGYYALLKEISEDLGKIKGLDKSKIEVLLGEYQLHLYIFDKLDTWNFLNGIPTDIDLGVSIRSINILRNIWQGVYTPRTTLKRSTYTVLRNPFNHFINGEELQGDETSMHKYCVNVLGYVYDSDDYNFRNLCTVDDRGIKSPAKVTTIANESPEYNCNIIGLKLKFVNALTGKDCGNEIFNIMIHCGAHHFSGTTSYDGVGIEPIKNEKGDVIEEGSIFMLGVAGENNNTTWTAKYSEESVLYKKQTYVSRIEKKGIVTDPYGFVELKLGIPNSISSVDMAYIEISSKDYASHLDDTYFVSYQLVNSLTYTGSDTDPIICKILPKNMERIVPDEDNVEFDKDYKKNVASYRTSLGAQFIANTDEFVYIDTSSPTDKLSLSPSSTGEDLMYEKGKTMYTVEDVNMYLNDEEFCKPESQSFTFTQFLVSSELSEDERKKIRIEAEISIDEDQFTHKVSSCLRELWLPDLYDGEEYGKYDMTTKVAIEKRQTLLLEDAIKHPERYKTIFYNTRSEYGGLQNGKGTIYVENEDDIPEKPDSQVLYKMMGHIKNMNYKLNFDSENIFPCTLVIKDFNEGNNKSDFVSTAMLPQEIIGSAIIRIYAYYKKTSSSYVKMLLGETGYGSTLEEANPDGTSSGSFGSSREEMG